MARSGRTDRGAILIWAVLALVAIGSLTALALNIGRVLSVRGGLQNGADGAALAGAAELNGQASGITDGQDAAVGVAARHYTDSGQAVVIDRNTDIVFGSWDRQSATFTPIAGRTAADLRIINAVQVRDGREAARGNEVPVIFGGAFLKRTGVDVGASAVAVGGGPCEDKCAFPAAFADCLMINPDGSLNCDERFYVLNNDWQDNLGLTSLDPDLSASVPNIKDALKTCVESNVDEPIPVSNGNPMQPISVDPFFNRLPLEVSSPVVHVERCEPPHYQKCVQLSPTDPCLDPKFVGDLQIVGYATFTLCYVTGAVVKEWPPADWPAANPDCGPAPTLADFPGVDPSQWPDPFLKQTLFLKHKCYVEQPGSSGVAGCGFFGTSSPRSRLVQ